MIDLEQELLHVHGISDFEQRIVATHEAGHALVALLTPLRDYLGHARIFLVNGKWQGKVSMDSRDWRKADPFAVYAFAKAIAGPLAQIRYYPKSVPADIINVTQQGSGLLAYAKQIHLSGSKVQVEWWPDLVAWLSFAHYYPGLSGFDYVQVENELVKFFGHASTKDTVENLSEELIANGTMDSAALLAQPIDQLPSFALPQMLRLI